MSIRGLRRFARLRGAIALGMLLALVASNAEAVVGDMHEGAEHHESMADALVHHLLQGPAHVHVADRGATHGPEGSPAAPQDEGQDPRGGSDHCSHLHGVGIPTYFALEFPSLVTQMRTQAAEPPAGRHTPVLPHPPKA